MNKYIKQISILCILLTASFSFAQTNTALIEIPFNQNPRKIFEKYYISLPDSLKNGNCTRYNMWQGIVAEGKYKNDVKVGIWKYFDDQGRPLKTLDHTSQKVILIETTENVYAQYFGDQIDLSNYLNKKIKELFSQDELIQLKGKQYTVHFKVDENGKPIEVETKWYRGQFPMSDIEQRLIKIIQEMPNWVITNKKDGTNLINLPINF